MDKNILIALIGTIMIPLTIAVENWFFRSRRDKRDINKIIYVDKFNFTFNQLFNNKDECENSLGNMNIDLIREMIIEVNKFNELGNRFKGKRVQRKFTAMSNITDKILKSKMEHKWFKYTNIEDCEGATNFYNDFKDDLFKMKIKFIEFYKSIYDAI